VFVQTLRNLWVSVTLVNPGLNILALAVLPLEGPDSITGQVSVLSQCTFPPPFSAGGTDFGIVLGVLFCGGGRDTVLTAMMRKFGVWAFGPSSVMVHVLVIWMSLDAFIVLSGACTWTWSAVQPLDSADSEEKVCGSVWLALCGGVGGNVLEKGELSGLCASCSSRSAWLCWNCGG
jgi:hypothetical protein